MITEIPDWQNLTAQQILDYLLATEAQPDKTSWTLKEVTKQLGAEFAGKLEISMESMGAALVPFAKSSLRALSSKDGLTLHEPEMPPLIDSLAAASQSLAEPLRWDAAFVTAVKGLGTKQVARWITMAYPTEPTLVSVQTELDEALDRAARETVTTALYSESWNTHIAPILDGTASTATVANLASGLRALADAIEGV